MEEIKQILKRYDIGGVVVIHTPGFAEYLNKLNPSYSCAQLEPDGHVTIRLKKEHYNGDTKLRDQFASDTANMFHILSEALGRSALNVMQVSKMIDQQIDAEHFGPGHSSHTDQNN